MIKILVNFFCCCYFSYHLSEEASKNLWSPSWTPYLVISVLTWVDNWLARSVAVLSEVLFFSLQGVDSAILVSQPFLLITKPTGATRPHSPQFLLNVFLLLLLRQFWSKDIDETILTDERNMFLTFKSSFPVKETADIQASASVLPLHWGMSRLAAPALQSPCSWTPSVLFICISISHSCTSLLHWCGSKWLKATGFTTDTRSGATMQNKASSHELPMICIAEVTLYPGCAITVI